MEDTKNLSFQISMGLTRLWMQEVSNGIAEIPLHNPDYPNMDRMWRTFIRFLGHRNSKFSHTCISFLEIYGVTFNMLAFLDMTLRRVEKILEDSDNPQYGPELREITQIKKQLEDVVIAW